MDDSEKKQPRGWSKVSKRRAAAKAAARGRRVPGTRGDGDQHDDPQGECLTCGLRRCDCK